MSSFLEIQIDSLNHHCHRQLTTDPYYNTWSKISLPITFFAGQQVLPKENEPGNVIKARRCTRTKNEKIVRVYISLHLVR